MSPARPARASTWEGTSNGFVSYSSIVRRKSSAERAKARIENRKLASDDAPWRASSTAPSNAPWAVRSK
jgi:hypothetical protein